MSKEYEEGEAYGLYYRNKRYWLINTGGRRFNVYKYKEDVENEEDLEEASLGDYGKSIPDSTFNIMINSKTLTDEPVKEKSPSPPPRSPSPDLMDNPEVGKAYDKAEEAGVSNDIISKCLNGKTAQQIIKCLLEKRKKKLVSDKLKEQKKEPKKELTTAELNERFKKITPESRKAYKDEMEKNLKEFKEIKARQKKPKENIKLTVNDLSKQPAPPRKSAGQRVRAVRSDKGKDHNWKDGREKTKTYKENEDVDWSRVRCRDDTCWKTNTRKTDATTKNKKAGDEKVYQYNVDKGHYIKQLRRKKKTKG